MTHQSDFSWHAAALKGTRGPISEGEPRHGFYRQRKRSKDSRISGPYEPVAYWADANTGELRCHINGKQPDELRALETWPYASKNPISTETYWHFIDTGEWLDNDPTAHAAAQGPAIDPAQDPVGSLAAEIAAAKAGADAYKVIESDEAMARAQSLRSTLTGLKGKAEAGYEAANRPLLDQQQELRKTWFPLRDDAGGTADAIRKALGVWNDVKLAAAKAAREAQEKAQREADAKTAAEAEAHRKAVAAAAKANEPPPPPPPEPTKPAPVVASNAPPPSSIIRGGSGRAASVKIVKTVVVDDEPAVYAYLKQDEVAGGLIAELIQRLAQKAFDAGQTVPGIHTDDKSDVR